MDNEQQQQRNRLTNRKRSNATKMAWKKHHASYMKGTRERERNTMNKTFYGVARELGNQIKEDVEDEDVFDLECTFKFNTIAGGLTLKVSEDSTVSIATNLDEDTAGNYLVKNNDGGTDSELLYNDLKAAITNVVDHFDSEIKNLLLQHGLRQK